MSTTPHCASDVLDRLSTLAEEHEEVSLADAIEEFGHRSFSPFLVLIPLLELSPIGGIPGVPTFLALIVALIAAQLVIGNDHLWLPGFIENRSVAADKLDTAVDKLGGVARFLDKWFQGRLQWLTHGVPVRIAGVIVILLCLSIPPLEFIPFASSGPMLAIAIFGLSLMTRDGLLMLVAAAISIAAVIFGITSLGGSEGGLPFL